MPGSWRSQHFTRCASEDENLVGLPTSGVAATAESDLELTTMLSRAAASIGQEVCTLPSSTLSQLDDWFLGMGHGSQPGPAPVAFFLEVQEELMKLRTAPFLSRSRSSVCSILTTLNGGAAMGYVDIPQVESAFAVHLCPARRGPSVRRCPHLWPKSATFGSSSLR